MKRSFLLASCVAASLSLFACGDDSSSSPTNNVDRDTIESSGSGDEDESSSSIESSSSEEESSSSAGPVIRAATLDDLEKNMVIKDMFNKDVNFSTGSKNGVFSLWLPGDSYEAAWVVVHSDFKDGVIDFLIEGDGDYKGVIISLYKEKTQKVLGLSEYDGYIATEKKLAFYLENKYLFENVNIRKYDFKVLDKIFITAYQKRIRFLIDTINQPDDMMRMNGVNIKKFKIVKKRKVFELTEDLYSLSDNERDGIIVKNCDELDMVNFLKEHYGQVIYMLRPHFRPGSHLLSYFGADEIKKQSNGLYKIDFSKPNASYGFKTVIRKYFDTDLTGIYLDTSGYSQEDMEIMKGAIVSVLTEYTKKILLFDRISGMSDFCGYYVIKDRKKIFSKNYTELYKYSGEYYLAAEVRSYSEIKKVPDACGIVIVNNTL